MRKLKKLPEEKSDEIWLKKVIRRKASVLCAYLSEAGISSTMCLEK
jgi:hypothetical protein